MLNTSNATRPIPVNSVASATESYSSQCQYVSTMSIRCTAAKPHHSITSSARSRIAVGSSMPIVLESLGLVAALGFLVVVSLIVSTALTAFGKYLNSILPFGQLIPSRPSYRY